MDDLARSPHESLLATSPSPLTEPPIRRPRRRSWSSSTITISANVKILFIRHAESQNNRLHTEVRGAQHNDDQVSPRPGVTSSFGLLD